MLLVNLSFNSLKVIIFYVWQLKVSKYIIKQILARNLQTQSSRKQTTFHDLQKAFIITNCIKIDVGYEHCKFAAWISLPPFSANHYLRLLVGCI